MTSNHRKLEYGTLARCDIEAFTHVADSIAKEQIDKVINKMLEDKVLPLWLSSFVQKDYKFDGQVMIGIRGSGFYYGSPILRMFSDMWNSIKCCFYEYKYRDNDI